MEFYTSLRTLSRVSKKLKLMAYTVKLQSFAQFLIGAHELNLVTNYYITNEKNCEKLLCFYAEFETFRETLMHFSLKIREEYTQNL